MQDGRQQSLEDERTLGARLCRCSTNPAESYAWRFEYWSNSLPQPVFANSRIRLAPTVGYQR